MSIQTPFMNLSRYREFFPITQNTVYLNHAAISPLSLQVTDAIQLHLENRSSGRIDVYEDILAAKDRLKTNIAQLIGCQTQQVAIISNTSE